MKLLCAFLTFLNLFLNVGNMDAQHDLAVLKDHSGSYFLFDSEQLISIKDTMSGPYLRFLDVSTISMGIYSLEAGQSDNQHPHDWDEVYVVIEGRAQCEVEDSLFAVKKGDLIFVKAHADHRFLQIEEDLKLLVFFSKKE